MSTPADKIDAAIQSYSDATCAVETALREIATALRATPREAPTPADPRREVGAVVTSPTAPRCEFIAITAGEYGKQHNVDGSNNGCMAGSLDKFSRWATADECARHGIPYIDRTPSPVAPVAKFKVGDRVRFLGRCRKTGSVGTVTEVRDAHFPYWMEFDDSTEGACAVYENEIELAPPPAAIDEAKEREAAMAAFKSGADGFTPERVGEVPACRDSFRNGWLACAKAKAAKS